jgi:hypothetical protein
MVKLEVALVPLGVTEAGEAEQVASVGRPLHASTTAALNPDTEFTVTVTFVVFPATRVAEAGLMLTPKSEPPPVKAITCGLLPALSTKVNEPSALPAVVGVKVTLIVQIPPAATVAFRQVLVCAKGSVAVIELKLSDAVPVLVTVTVCAALGVFSG